MNIAEVLCEQARERGDSPALIETHRGRDRILTFRVLEQSAARIAGQIERAGVRAGDRVLVLHPMRSELYVFLVALFRPLSRRRWHTESTPAGIISPPPLASRRYPPTI